MRADRVSERANGERSVVRLIVTNWILGAGVGILFASLLLWLDIAGLRHLMFRGADAAVGLALLFGGFAVTFGSVVCGSAIMAMAREDDGDRGRGEPVLSPVKVRQPNRR